jgi:Flp pilus assembly protein TadG
MDDVQEVERNRAPQAVSAKVHTRVGGRVSFGEPEESAWSGAKAAIFVDFRRRPMGNLVWCGRSESMRTNRILLADRWRIRSPRSGQTVVELAMLLPLLLVLCVGVIEIGRYAYFDILIASAARAGAQYGAQSLIQAADQSGIQAAAQNDGLHGMTVTSLQECGCPGATPGACPNTGPCVQQVYVQVTASDTYDSLFGFSWLPVPTSINLSSTVTMRVSQ